LQIVHVHVLLWNSHFQNIRSNISFFIEVLHLQPKRYLSKLLVCLKSSWYTDIKYIFFKKNIILMYLQAKSMLKYNWYWNIKGARILKYQKQHLFFLWKFRICSQNDIYLNF
jgi:uncharacterized membrane protein